MFVSKTKSSFYRRLFVAYLIDTGFDTIPKIQAQVNIPRRTLQDTIEALNEIDIECQFNGARKNGSYNILSWGPFNRGWVQDNIAHIQSVLGY